MEKGEHMLNGYIDALKKYAVFKGRSRRKEYWTFTLINIAVLVCLTVAEQITGISGIENIFSIYVLAVFLPALSVTIRRLHDIDRNGWWVFITIIPLIGSIILLVFMLLESTPGENRFGPCPA